MEKYLEDETITRRRAAGGAFARATIAMTLVPRPLRRLVQEQGRAAAARRAWSTTCRRPLDIPPVQGDQPRHAEDGGARGRRRRAVLRAGVQDHDRPVRRASSRSCACTPARSTPGSDVYNSTQREEGARRPPPAACTPTSARRSRRSTPATSRRWSACKHTTHRRHALRRGPARSCSSRWTFPEPVISVAIEPKTKADQEKLGCRSRGWRSRTRPSRSATDAETGQTLIHGHGRAAPRDHRRPDAARVQGRGQRRQAAGRLPRDDPPAGRGRGQVRAPDRRPRPVRRTS